MRALVTILLGLGTPLLAILKTCGIVAMPWVVVFLPLAVLLVLAGCVEDAVDLEVFADHADLYDWD